MKRAFKHKIALFYVLVTFLSLAAYALCSLHSLGYRINLSGSLPGYLYRVIPLRDGEPIHRGDCAVIDVSRVDNLFMEIGIRRGYIRRDRSMLKEIGGMPGDVLEMRDNMLFVNGRPAPMILSPKDSRGRALSPYPTPITLAPDFYWLVSAPRGGFDSRYFGPISRSAFTHKARPVF